jgi:hypothetical protein
MSRWAPVAKLTLSVDGDVLRRARIRALQSGTSVNALVREYLESFAGESPASRGLEDFLARAEERSGGSAGGGRAWSRDEVHERPGA